MNKVWYRNPSKSEVIGHCGGDEKTEWSRRTDKSRTLNYLFFKLAPAFTFICYLLFVIVLFIIPYLQVFKILQGLLLYFLTFPYLQVFMILQDLLLYYLLLPICRCLKSFRACYCTIYLSFPICRCLRSFRACYCTF